MSMHDLSSMESTGSIANATAAASTHRSQLE